LPHILSAHRSTPATIQGLQYAAKDTGMMTYRDYCD